MQNHMKKVILSWEEQWIYFFNIRRPIGYFSLKIYFSFEKGRKVENSTFLPFNFMIELKKADKEGKDRNYG